MKKKYFLTILLFIISNIIYSQDKRPKGICYVEVNNYNLLNVGAYTLQTSGKQVFDVAIIFAANINYDTSKQRAYLYNNNNVTKVLNNAATYVQPLQEKGIKVLLSVLGNHQGAGICNFPDQESARDFAVQLANTVYTYGLDGIDFDDEYANYGNNDTGQPNESSFVMLVQELRLLMPDKIISFYYYGPAKTRLSWNGYRVGDYVNYSWNAVYGSFSIPSVPPLTKDYLSPAATWISNTSVTALKSLANKTKDQDYGLFLWYDLHNSDESTYLTNATNILYAENAVLSGTLQSWSSGASCDPPLGLTSSDITSNSAKLSWTANGTNTYTLDYKKASETSWTNIATNISTTEVTVSGLTENETYDWRIMTSCSVNSTYIFAPRFKTELLAVNETNENSSLRIYPNPILSGNILNLLLDRPMTDSVYIIYDISGKQIMTKPFTGTQVQIQTAGLATGTYICKVVSNKNIIKSVKFIVK